MFWTFQKLNYIKTDKYKGMWYKLSSRVVLIGAIKTNRTPPSE